MSIFGKIIERLRSIVKAVEHRAEEVREHYEKRQAESLAVQLDEIAKGVPYKNWRTSIEDLVYLAGQDGSYAGRAALWADLKCNGEYEGSAKQNITLHKAFLERLPSEGIPWPKAEG
jgi:hypothetical protein